MTQETPVAVDPSKISETWEVTTESTVWLWKRDPRNPGEWTQQRVGGRGGGSRRIRITTDERQYNEEHIIEEMSAQNPFRNGLLRLVSAEGSTAADLGVDDRYHWTEQQYLDVFDVRGEAAFREAVTDIDSELVLRRLYMHGEKLGTQFQMDVLRELIDTRYKAGGTQKTVQEMMDEEARIGSTISSF